MHSFWTVASYALRWEERRRKKSLESEETEVLKQSRSRVVVNQPFVNWESLSIIAIARDNRRRHQSS